jgi:processive 1,2-diacylglycerol beta-glucosyltransferase
VGHTSAAEAVGLVLREDAVDVAIVDSYKYAASYFSKVVADGYLGMVKTIPQLYRFIYDRAERASGAGAFRKWVSRYTAQNLRTLIGEIQPSCVVCTHAFPCGVMSQYKKQVDADLPVVGIVTDFVVHPFWIYRNVDAYAVATRKMHATLVDHGVSPERIQVTGIPVDPRFALRPSQAQARRALGLPAQERVVLVMAGGLGIGPLETMLTALAQSRRPVHAVVLVGRNPRRQQHLTKWAQRLPYPVEVHGFVHNVFDYMHAADVLLTKPGGLTTSEALVAQLPMVLVKPLPGQEERNTRYLCDRGAAMVAVVESGIARAVEQLLDDDAGHRSRLLQRVETLRRPEGAADVAEIVRRLTHGGREPQFAEVVG